MVEQRNQSESINQAIAGEIAHYLQAYLETGYFMGSVLVARGSEILLSEGYGMANLEHFVPNTPFGFASSLRRETRLQDWTHLTPNFVLVPLPNSSLQR